jgi:UPF0755 protein
MNSVKQQSRTFNRDARIRYGMRSALLVLGTAFLMAVVAALVYGALQYRAFVKHPLSLPRAGLVITIPSGSSLQGLASELHELGVIARPRFLVLLGRQMNAASRIKAGEYHLQQGTTPPGMLEKLIEGDVVQHALTIVEGWTFRDLMSQIHGNDVLVPTLEDLDESQIMERLGQPDVSPEGRFFPDTYHFPRGTTDLEFLERARDVMDRHLREAWEQRAEGLPLQSPDEALVLASIVEKETGAAGERDRIAGVFIRRLRKGMRLQTDPTVIYGLGDEFDGNLRTRDLKTDTPYNTYTRVGLPPTPIAIPGMGSINAVLHPADGDTLYFVAKGDGSHYFSSSLREHNKAVRKYQLAGRQR